jgi:hypothetical protein
MRIQLWYAEFVPALVPDWIDSHITVEYDVCLRKDIYIFQVDINHNFFSRTKYPDRKVRQTLKKLGFIKPQFIVCGQQCEFIIDGRPPKSTDMFIPYFPNQ